MSDTPARYPLAWPKHKPRTPAHARKAGRFSRKRDTGQGWSQTVDVTVPGATERLEEEVRRLGGQYPLLSTNVETRLDGRPRGGAAAPADPGVALYFTLKGEPYTMACDTFTDVAQNIAALAAHIEATRAIERYGVATAAETLQAFAALPPPGPSVPTVRHWADALGLPRDIVDLVGPKVARVSIEAAWRERAAHAHPDRPGGSHDTMAALNAAKEAALKELGE